MNILFMMDSPMSYMSGIWMHRNQTPCTALGKRGHACKQVAIGNEIPEHLMNWPDVVIFGRAYPQQFDPVKFMYDYKKLGKRVLYDMDDDFWSVAKDNPSVLVSNAHKDQYEGMIEAADAVITPSPILAKKFKKHFKKTVFICPNGIDFCTKSSFFQCPNMAIALAPKNLQDRKIEICDLLEYRHKEKCRS